MRWLVVVAVVVGAVFATAVYGVSQQQQQQQQDQQKQQRDQQQKQQQEQQWQAQQQEMQRQQQQKDLERQQQSGTSGTSSSTSKSAPPVFIVIKVTDTKGDVAYDVSQSTLLRDRQKQAVNGYKAALEKWKKDKVDAAAGKKKFDEKQPLQGKVERVDTDPVVFKTQDLAKAEADKLTKKMEDRKKGVAATTTTTDTTATPAPHAPPTGKVVKAPDTTEENQNTGDKNP